jgi:hypothetical protein
MDQKVAIPFDRIPAWSALRDLLARRNLLPQLRMIDGELALPDEQPPDTWKELRVGTPLGMVTLRREPDGIRLVTWGNADAAMRQAWNALTWAVAVESGGMIETGGKSMKAEEFARTAELPAGFNS